MEDWKKTHVEKEQTPEEKKAVKHLKMKMNKQIEELQLPEKPKRPMSLYFKFRNDHQKFLQEQNPDMPYAEITKKINEDYQ